ncbi:MAG: EpsG family protein [Clostridia bacterium]|nr:EpsG family protein [Clostridia bacterium]
MNIFVVNILFTMLWGFILLAVNPTAQKRKLYIALMSLNWILISGLRGVSVGADTLSYRRRFERTLTTPWNKLFENFYMVYVNEEGKDPGYAVFEKIVQIFTDNYQVYLVVIAAVFFIGLAFWIYRYSSEPCMSYLIFSSFLFGFYALTGLRQTIATVLVVFIGTKLIEKRKLIPFLLVVLVAFTVHKSAICFLPFYFLSRIPVNKKSILAVLCATPILFLYNDQIFRVLGYLVGYEYDELENRGAYGFTFMYIAVTVVMLLLLKLIKKKCPHYKMYYNALFMGLLFLPLVFVNPTAMRAVQYYSLFLMLSVPEIVKAFEKKIGVMVYVGMLIILFSASSVYSYEYVFFWQ